MRKIVKKRDGTTSKNGSKSVIMREGGKKELRGQDEKPIKKVTKNKQKSNG